MGPLLLLLCVLLALPCRAEPVDLALVMAVDVSASVDEGNYQLQHEGIARAFEDERLAAAVANGPHHAIEAAVIEWSDRDKQVIAVNWTPIRDSKDAAGFAAKVRATRRSSNGLTAIGDALLAAAALLAEAPDQPARRAIDISGDGMANIGPPVREVRDRLVSAGITINGLPILTSEPWLGTYYNDNVIGGPGAFLLEAEGFHSFADAIMRKLLAEITLSALERDRVISPLRCNRS